MKILTKLCIVCGKEFAKTINCSRKEWIQKRYCSHRCVNTGRPSWNKGIKTGFIPKTAFKKGEFRHPETAFKKGQFAWNKGLDGKEYLSIEARKRMSVWGGKSGESTPNWRGGTTKLGQLIRSCKMYSRWRLTVFARDNRICVKCMAKNIPIHADHIKPFYKILEDNEIKTVEQAKQCKELWDITNGRTLCIPCHMQTSSYLNVR